jgi:hypothetical protein
MELQIRAVVVAAEEPVALIQTLALHCQQVKHGME